jgi:hypothetical protein
MGKALIAAWAVRHGRSRFPDVESVTDAVLAVPAPHELSVLLAVEDRITGPIMADWSEWMAAASASFLIQRSGRLVFLDIDRLGASDILSNYSASVVAWAKAIVDRLSDGHGPSWS